MQLNIFSWEYSYNLDDLTKEDKKAVEDIGKKINRGVTAGLGFILANGEGIQSNSTGCFAGLSSPPKKTTPIKYCIAYCMNPHSNLDEKLGKQYIHWLVNASPFASVYVEKDPNTIWKKHFILSAKAPANMLAASAVCTRWLSEGQNEGPIQIWGELVNKCNADPTYAFVFSHLYNVKSDTSIYPIICSPGRDTHNLGYFTHTHIHSIKNLCTHNLGNLLPPYYQYKGYRDIEKMWGGETKVYNDKKVSLGEICKKLTPKVVIRATDYNVFSKYMITDSEKMALINNPTDLQSVFEQFVERVNAA